MTDRARRLLDNLLGNNRDNTIQNEDSTSNCIYYIAGGCPFEMLKNTKLSIGLCKYKKHELIETVNKVLYEQELIKVLDDLFDKINQRTVVSSCIDDQHILETEESLDFKILEIEQNINEENIKEMYNKFLDIENEIFDLEKLKEAYFVKNKEKEMDKCEVCGLHIIRNFCSNKYISHIKGRAHRNVKKLKALYKKIKSNGF